MNLSLSFGCGVAKRRSQPDFVAKQCHEDILDYYIYVLYAVHCTHYVGIYTLTRSLIQSMTCWLAGLLACWLACLLACMQYSTVRT